MSRLVLGTVQLGKDYGIANTSGRPDDTQAREVLTVAWEAGMRWLDTASDYGDSEARIGAFLKVHPEMNFSVVTKLGSGIDMTDESAVLKAVAGSRDRLGVTPKALLLHDPTQLAKWSEGQGQALRRCRKEGLTQALGASIYTPDEFALALENPDVDFIQAPMNAFDPRLLETGLMDRAAGKQVFIRSVFLQGLLLSDPKTLPPHMAFAAPSVTAFQDICRDAGLRPEEVALRYIFQTLPNARIIVGCETSNQLRENLANAAGVPLSADVLAKIRALPWGGERLVNPALWNR